MSHLPFPGPIMPCHAIQLHRTCPHQLSFTQTTIQTHLTCQQTSTCRARTPVANIAMRKQCGSSRMEEEKKNEAKYIKLNETITSIGWMASMARIEDSIHNQPSSI